MVTVKDLVICPVYNEEKYLLQFYLGLRRYYMGDVLFVDDGSTDKSRNVLRDIRDKNTFLIRHTQRMGYGAALISGFKFALDKGYKRIVTMDTDLQHNPEHIYLFFRELLEVEVVLGSRYIRIDKYGEIPYDRLLINRYISKLLKVLFFVNISDPFCGLRGYRDSFLLSIWLKEQGYRMGLEILLELIRTKRSFSEIPIEAIYFNPERKFGNGLDNSRQRLLYYLEVIARKQKEIVYEKKVLSSQSSSR
jgi:dolichol-phosphate mannosyltransferase